MNQVENKKTYESPKVEEIQVALEYGIASASVEPNSMKESWESNSSNHDLEW